MDNSCSAKLHTLHWLAIPVDQHSLYGDGTCHLCRQEKQALQHIHVVAILCLEHLSYLFVETDPTPITVGGHDCADQLLYRMPGGW